MKYWKSVANGYIQSIGIGNGKTQISESEYNEILNAFNNKPKATKDKIYRLKTDLTWEEYDVEPIEVEDEPSAEEILDILTGEQE